jgi:hypothetical protein
MLPRCVRRRLDWSSLPYNALTFDEYKGKIEFAILFCFSSFFVCCYHTTFNGVGVVFRVLHVSEWFTVKWIKLSTIYRYPRILTSKGIRVFEYFICYLACQKIVGKKYVAACQRIFNADRRGFITPSAVWVLPARPPEKNVEIRLRWLVSERFWSWGLSRKEIWIPCTAALC